MPRGGLLGALAPLTSNKQAAATAADLKPAAAMAQDHPPKKMSHKEREEARRNIEPQRFALIFDPPTIVLEYRDKKKDSLRHRKMQLPSSCLHDADVAVHKLVRHNPIHLHASVVSKEQVKRLVAKLLSKPASPKPAAAKPAAAKPAAPQAPASPEDLLDDLGDLELDLDSPQQPGSSRPADPYAADPYAAAGGDPFAKPPVSLDKGEVMRGGVDLNKVDEEVLVKAKELMDEEFSKNALKPGDAGYEHDKRVEFEVVQGVGDWDDDSDDEIEEELIDAGSPLSMGGPGSPLDTGEDDDMYNF